MESSSGEEYYVVSDNTGIFLVVFSINGFMIKQLQYIVYGEIYYDFNFDFQMVIGFYGGFYDFLIKLVYFIQRDYDVLVGRWIFLDYIVWKNVGKESVFFNLYMFKSNNFFSNELDLKNYVIGEDFVILVGQWFLVGWLFWQIVGNFEKRFYFYRQENFGEL